MNTENKLYPEILAAFSQVGAKFPHFLAAHFERILQQVESFWGEKETVDYLDQLFLDKNHDAPDELVQDHEFRVRHGFPVEAVEEIVLLKQVHQLLFPSLNFNLNDPYSGTEILPLDASATTDEASQGLPGNDKKPPVNWPFINTQRDLIEIARLQHNKKNIYAMQGRKLGEILLHYGLIDDHNLQLVLNMQKRDEYKSHPIGEILIKIGIIQNDALLNALYIQSGIPMIDLLSIDIPQEIAGTIPQIRSREKFAVPAGNFQDTLYLAVPDPFTFKDQAFFTMMTGMKVILAFSPRYEIINRINATKNTRAAKEEFLHLAKSGTHLSVEQESSDEIMSSDVSEDDSIIVNLVNQMIFNAIQEEASDIHIEIFNDGKDARIRFRHDGNMEHFSDYPRIYHNALVSRIKIMSGLDIAEKRHPQDGKISFRTPDGRRFDLRVAVIPTTPGIEFVTIRILSSSEPVPLENLGMSNRDTAIFQELFRKPYGLILVCGPTGSGKTTTLHSVLKELNTEDRKIWTAEDPIEIVQSHLSQVQVNSKIGMTFAIALRSLLRADPDVIMIGEMRDQETAKIALEASMTGHLVLSTLHTNSASETMARLLDLDIDPFNLSDALLAILAQRLARKLCTFCARQEEATINDLDDLASEYYQSAHLKPPTHAERNDIIQKWREQFGVDGKIYLKHAVGCDQCRGGYRGRIGLYELLQVNPTMRHLIRQRSAASDYMSLGVADGMKTLKQDGIEKVICGITDMMQVHGSCI